MDTTISKIQKYFNGTSTYPLIIVLSSEEYKEVLEVYSGVPKIKVSDYCVGEDKEPDTGELQFAVKMCLNNNLLVGLGDYLASKTASAKKTLIPYKNLVLQNNARVVILLSAHMYPVVKEIYNVDPRARTRIILPKTTPEIIAVDDNAFVYGIKAYLEACERGENIGTVKTGRNIQNINVINPENAYDELKHKFPNEINRLPKDAGTDIYWGELLENTNKLQQSLRQYLGTQNFEPLEYTFYDHAKKNNYMAWLYFINLKLNAHSNTYMGYVASKSETQSELFTVTKTAILDILTTDKRFESFCNQRKLLLKNCKDVDMADYIPKIVVKGVDRIAYLTDNTDVEKKAVIVALCEGAKEESLAVSYPDLHHYMRRFMFDDRRFTDYFEAYKRCKLINKIDDGFLRLVDEYAKSRPYNSLPSRASLFIGLDDGNTLLIFLDALGVEFLGYIKEKCTELGLRAIAKVARAELPTITSDANKSFYDEWKGKSETTIKDLDEIKHDPERGYDYSNSKYPIHLVEELKVIKTALERAKINLYNECERVIIASDHGASRLTVISPDTRTPNNGCDTKSNGRYCIGSNPPTAPNIVTDEGYAVIADYSRFEGSRIASVEAHGGATLEEVLVPVIELTLLGENKEVTLENDITEVSFNLIPTLVFFVTPDCENITASVDETFHMVEKLEKSKFKIEMPDLKKGKYTLNIFENQNRIASKEFTVKSKGFAERDMF